MTNETNIDERIDTRYLLSLGKRVRLDNIMDRKTGRTVIIPMDHWVSGPVKGLDNMAEAVDKVAMGGANAIILHKGIIKYSWRGPKGSGRPLALGVHTSAGNPVGPNEHCKSPVATVEDALRYDADFVSNHMNVGSENQDEQFENFGNLVSECEKWGMPLLSMMYYRGPKISKDETLKPKNIKYVARLGAELGADIVKVNYTGDKESFEDVVKSCPAPIVIAGGPKREKEEEFLQDVYDSIQAGGKGVSIGRNIFEHSNPTYMTRVICNIVHEDMKPEDAKLHAK